MPNIARTTPRPAARANVPPAKTKILLVRQPVKSVRPGDEPSRAGLRLAYGVVTALGVIAALWLLGDLGFRLGFAPAVRVPDLNVEGGSALAVGVFMLFSLPQTILETGMAEPMWLMLGFALIAIPAAILGAVKPVAPGGPRPRAEVVALSIIGAIFAAMNAAVMVSWTVSPLRANLLTELPLAALGTDQWLTKLRLAGGMDALGTAAAALWVVVIMRLAIPLWLRVLTASACFFGLAVIAVAMAMSNVAASQLTAPRSIAFFEDESVDAHLVLGHTSHGVALMRVQQNGIMVDVRGRPMDLNIIGRDSIIGFVAASSQPSESE